ncbi:TIGR03773 family transporter-associated surface protein [Glycomyces luteolus]|uniref:TIGR03773 family transporter-associated surface protein n=1 Tax=Glycomyces luteolus TaxID=2670330 RepID=A0A9X3PF64_9ACTN|nr:TIGR03773 family transporter-associated surface protein [Glycomyces luteolus]MDA1361474.1 TIGR03773 family transporter-associated surface protein [Glycomyces luteolus]
MRRHRRIAALAGAAALAAGLYAAPANAQVAEGLAEFETAGSRLEINAPGELATVPSIVPEREDFAFLGEAGDLVWVAGTVDGQTFPMLDAKDVDTDVEVSLSKTDGPGEAWLYTFEGAGFAAPLASTADEGSFTLTAGTAAPVVLAVNEPGQYTLELVAQEDEGAKGSVATTGHGQAATTARASYSVTAEDATVQEAQSNATGGNNGSAQAGTSCEVVNDGHVDIGPRFVDGTWTVQMRDDRASESVWRDLEDVVLQVPDAGLFPIPEGDFGFLGAAGDEIYMLPQVQASGIVWPGWNTQDSSVIDGVPGAVEWNLTKVDGPGNFTIFLTGTFGGAEILFNSAEALPQTVSIPRNTHAHGNWTFSEPGVYRLTVEFTATTGDGATVSDTKDIQVAVGNAADTNTACSGGDSGDGGGDSGDKDEDGGFLPTTGTGWLLWGLGAAAAAVVIGVIIMFATRKRRNTTGPEAAAAEDADAS